MKVGRLESALQMKRDVYSGRVKKDGEEHKYTLIAANNYSSSLNSLERFEEAKSLLRKTMPVARRVLGDNDENTLRLRWSYAKALYRDPTATLDDFHEAVETHEDLDRIALRVFGGAHPATEMIQGSLRESRAALAARGDLEAIREAMAAMTPPGARVKATAYTYVTAGGSWGSSAPCPIECPGRRRSPCRAGRRSACASPGF